MVFENYIPQVAFVVVAIILTLIGDLITEKIIRPFVERITQDFVKYLKPIIGTVLFILWFCFGSWIFEKLLVNGELINSSNVDMWVVLGFIITIFIFNWKYKMSW